MIVVGIDPGLTGAVACIGHKAQMLHLQDIPVMERGSGGATVKNQVNATALAELLREWLNPYDKNEILVVIEMAQSMPAAVRTKGGGIKIVQGGSSIFSTGHSAGMIEGVVGACHYQHRLVKPTEWKKVMRLTATKEQCRAYAQRLYPEAPLHLMKHHNRAEALLLARYGHQLYA